MTPTVQLSIDDKDIKANVPHLVGCWSFNTEVVPSMMFLTINGKQHDQNLQSQINEDNKTYDVYSWSNVTFTKTENRKEISCGARWRNKDFTSESETIIVSCKHDILY